MGRGGRPSSDAASALRAAGFVVVATTFRPIGGWLSDRTDGARVLSWALGIVAVGAIVAAFSPPLPAATVAFLSIAAALGLDNGAVFAGLIYSLWRFVSAPQAPTS